MSVSTHMECFVAFVYKKEIYVLYPWFPLEVLYRSSWVNPGGGEDSETRRPDTPRSFKWHITHFLCMYKIGSKICTGDPLFFFINKFYQKKPKIINIVFFNFWRTKEFRQSSLKIKCFCKIQNMTNKKKFVFGKCVFLVWILYNW